MTIETIVAEQLDLVLQVTRAWARRAMAGKHDDVATFRLLMDYVEHWMQYLPNATTLDERYAPGTIPPPFEAARPAPPLMPDLVSSDYAYEAEGQTGVTFPPGFAPGPMWTEEDEPMVEER
jgi:hypothetical protein